MESSIAVFLKRQLACELLPTCGLDHVSLGLAFAGYGSHGAPWQPLCRLPEGRPRVATPLIARYRCRRRACRIKHMHLAR